MRKQNKNLAQETFDYFPKLEEWPVNYYHKLSWVISQSKEFNIFGMDIETQGLNPYDKRFKIISLAVSPLEGVAYSTYCLKETEMDDESVQVFRQILTNPNAILVGHNCKYDVNWIAVKLGVTVKCMLFDSMFAQYLLDETAESNSLEFLANKYFPDLKGYKEKVDRNRLDLMAKEDVLLYNCKDADASRRLYDVFVPKLIEGGYDKLMATSSMVLPVLSKMETRGVYLDKEWAYKTQTKIFNELVSLRYSMVESVGMGFKPDSPDDLGKILYKKLGFQITKLTKTGKPSTDSEAIGYLVDQATTEQQNKFIDQILIYKKQMKLLTTYYQPIERWTRYDGRVHANYSLGRFENEEGSGGTVTGRLSCREPNLQNIPRGKEHRGMFAATPGYTLLDGDFSQLELRVAAFLSQEPVMMEAFLNNLDIHSAVMSDLTGMQYDEIEEGRHTNEKIKNDRVAIKRVNFGILYGVQARRLQRLLRIELGIHQELDYCKGIIRQWLSRYSNVAKWIGEQKLQAVANGFVTMPLGQRRRLPEASFEHTKEAAHALSQATNFPVQSFASWICLIGLRLLDDYFQSIDVDGHIIMQVHDSVTAEINIEKSNVIGIQNIKADIKRIMEQETLNYLRDVFGVNFNVPVVFDIELKERWN